MKKIIFYAAIGFFALLNVGCIKSQYIQRNQYLLNVTPSQKVNKRTAKGVLVVRQTEIEPQFANESFVYRTDSVHYLSDLYNAFFISPSAQVNQLLTKYLSGSNLFFYVTTDDNFIKANYTLKTKVTELYADYRNGHYPCAVIALHTVLFKVGEKKVFIVFNKTLRQSIPLATKDSSSLVKAWNIGLRNIFIKIRKSIQKVK